MPKPSRPAPTQKSETPEKGTDKLDFSRPVLYREEEVEILKGAKALTIDGAKEILGWTEVGSAGLYSPEIKQLFGFYIRMSNNTTNRPIDVAWIRVLAQEILQRRWKLNGYTIVIGRTGQVISGQHRLLALILAEHWRNGPKADHWAKTWSGPITIETLICRGIDEGDETFMTLNRERQGTGADTLYRSHLLADLEKASDRKAVAKILDNATKLLWHRTGAKVDAFAPHRTPAETVDWIERHPRLVEAARHIYEEDDEGKLSKYVSPGYAAGLLYLMASCKSDPAKHVEDRSEKVLDLSLWGKAEEFWVMLAKGQHDDEFKELRRAIGLLGNPDDGSSGSLAERVGVIVKGWQLYSQKQPFKSAGLKLRYVTDEDDVKTLDETPTVGGIDLGNPERVKEEKPAAPETPPEPVTTKNGAEEVQASFNSLKEAHPGKLLVFVVATKAGMVYRVWGGDAVAVSELIKVPLVKTANGLHACTFPVSDQDRVFGILVADGREVAIVRGKGDEASSVEYYQPPGASQDAAGAMEPAKGGKAPKKAPKPSRKAPEAREKTPAAKGKAPRRAAKVDEDLKAKQLAALEGK